MLLALSFIVVAGLTTGCGPAEHRAYPPHVLATVGTEPITIDEVRALLRDRPLPLVRVAGRPYAGPWRKALQRAIRDELLVREAARRGIQAQTMAGMLTKLIAAEKRTTDDLDVDSIRASEARAWYREHGDDIAVVAQATVAWAKIINKKLALTLLDRVAHADQDTFLRLVREADVADSGTATIHGNGGEGASPMVARAALATRAAGVTGLASGNNQWWLVRVESISFHQVSWDAATMYKVKSAMASMNKHEHLRRLADSLRERWPVQVREDRLAEVISQEQR